MQHRAFHAVYLPSVSLENIEMSESGISSYLDAHGANSSIATAPSCSPLRIRKASGGVPFGIAPRRDFRSDSSCDNPCGLYRRLGPERWPPEERGQL